MVLHIYILIAVFFVAGGLGAVRIAFNAPDKGKALAIKYVTYLVIVYSVASIFAFSDWKHIFAIILSTAGAAEIIVAWLQSERKKILLLSCGITVYSVLAILFISGIHVFENLFLLRVYAIVLTFDGFSQICGQLFGKTKITPKISPGKTVGGLAGGSIIAVLSGCWLFYAEFGLWKALAFSAICIGASLSGDLTASLFKRKCGIKDYSKILPGHGGILDRFDSFIACVSILFLIRLLQA